MSRLDPQQELATAEALVARRLGATRGQPPSARIRRLMGVLARKGYSQALAYRVVRAALDGELELAEDGSRMAELAAEEIMSNLADADAEPDEVESGWPAG